MPNEPTEPVQVEYTPEFKRNLRALANRRLSVYRVILAKLRKRDR